VTFWHFLGSARFSSDGSRVAFALALSHVAYHLAVSGNYAYIADVDGGLAILQLYPLNKIYLPMLRN
jgi:hypothetical protein